jgi:NTE family protein
MNPSDESGPKIGLLLTGGGARAAYQVGVLEAICHIRKASGTKRLRNPFAIITGTSAGAVNAAALASGCDQFDKTVRRIAAIWRQIDASQVYRSDTLSMVRSGARWLALLSLGWVIAKWRRVHPRSLLDNAPLAALLKDLVPLERLPKLMAQGHLQALAITASSYSSGNHITFFDGAPQLQPWSRSQRLAVRDRITREHLLASSAIPFVFPAIRLCVNDHEEYFGDGSMRQSAPLAAAIHLGAQRVLVVGAGRMHEPRSETLLHTNSSYPSLAQIAGHALSNIFLDALSVDLERVQRINQTLKLILPETRAQSTLKPIELLVISPSQRLDDIAARHIESMPQSVRNLLGSLGVSSKAKDAKGAALASYLLFESSYTQELMALGYQDSLNQANEVRRFFGWPSPLV